MKTRFANNKPNFWVHIAAKAALEKKPSIPMRLKARAMWDFPKSKQIVTVISTALFLSVLTIALTGFHYHQQIQTQRDLDRQEELFYQHLERHERRIDILHEQVQTRKKLESHMLAMMETYISPIPQKERAAYVAFLIDEARIRNINPSTALSLIAVESGFNPLAVSSKGAVGMAQLRPWVAKSIAKEAGVPWQGLKTLHDPYDNTRLGLYYLKTLMVRFGDLRLALDAYNQGPSTLSRKLRQGAVPIGDYSRKVLALADEFTTKSYI